MNSRCCQQPASMMAGGCLLVCLFLPGCDHRSADMNGPPRGVEMANSTTTEMVVTIEQDVASETASDEPENDAVEAGATSEGETLATPGDSMDDVPPDGLAAMDDAYKRFQFELAAKLAAEILESGIEDRHVLEVAAKSCFAIHRFYEAGRFLQKLQEKGRRDWGLNHLPRINARDYPPPQERSFLDHWLPLVEQVAEYETLWAYEQQIRQREASAEPDDLLPRVAIQTNFGEIELELFENEARQAVAHFIYLIESGRYDGSEFQGVSRVGLLQTAENAWGGQAPPGWYDPEATHDEAEETTADEAEPSEIMAEDSADSPPVFPSAPLQRSDGPQTWECFADDARPHFRGSISLGCYGRNVYSSELILAWMPQPLLNRDSQFEVFSPYAAELSVWQATAQREVDEEGDRTDSWFAAELSRFRAELMERHSEVNSVAFTNFGRVVRGIELLPALQDGGRIISARVIRKRSHDYRPISTPTFAEEGRFDEAIREALNLRESMEAQYGPQHRLTLDAANQLGLAYLAAANNVAARLQFERVHQGREAVFGLKHPLTAEALNNLGVAHFREGNWTAARRQFSEALAFRRTALRSSHPDTVQSAVHLAVVTGDRDSMVGQSKYLAQLVRANLSPSSSSADLLSVVEAQVRRPALRISLTETDMLYAVDSERIRRDDELFQDLIPSMPSFWPRDLYRLVLMESAMQSCVHPSLAETAAVLQSVVWGPAHLQTALALCSLVAEPPSENSPPDALQIRRLEYALDIIQKTVGDDHHYTAAAHHNLGANLLRMPGRQEEALRHLEAAQQTCLAVFGSEHPRTATALEAIGIAALQQRDLLKARATLEQAARIRRSVCGADHFLTAHAYHTLGQAMYLLGDTDGARRQLEWALDVYEMNDEQVSLVHQCLNDLAVVAKSQGDLVLARRLLERASIDDPVIRANLWALRAQMGDWELAAHQLERLLDRFRSGRGDEARKNALSNLGVLALRLGKPDVAAKRFKQVLDLDDHDDTALSGLGNAARILGYLEIAEQCLQHSLRQRQRQFGRKHLRVALAYAELGRLDQARGDYAAARERLRESLEISKKLRGPTAPTTTQALRRLGENALMFGRAEEAVGYLEQALANKLRLANDLLPTLSEAEAMAHVMGFTERDLLLAAHDQLESSAATVYDVVWKTRGLATQAIQTRQDVPWTGDALKIANQLVQIRGELSSLILCRSLPQAGFNLSGYGPDPDALATDRLRELGEQKERLERQLMDASSEFRKMRQAQRADYTQLLDLIPDKVPVVDIIKTQPFAASGGVTENSSQGRYEAFVLKHSERTGSDEASGIVRVHLGEAEPIDAAVEAWRGLIRSRAGGATRALRWDAPAQISEQTPQLFLRRSVWDKVAPHVADKAVVVMIPDGTLARLPWSALPGDEHGAYLVHRHAIVTATFPQQILDLLSRLDTQPGQYLLVGDVDYDRSAVEFAGADAGIVQARSPAGYFPEEESTDDNAPADESFDDSAMRRLLAGDSAIQNSAQDAGDSVIQNSAQDRSAAGPWNNLPGAAKEIQRVERLVATTNPVVVLQSAEATESRVLHELPRSRFVHLATHGFFAAPRYPSALSTQPMSSSTTFFDAQPLRGALSIAPGMASTVVGRNPLTLSGIVLAGANQPRMRDDYGRYLGGDGILTAEELAGLDMSATELVVLSACETGLGEVAGGEGVMGLQRAFALAGARSVVSTLWSVEDAATLALMTEFYRELWQNKRSKVEALRHAQLTMLSRYDVQAQQLRDGPEDEESLGTAAPLPPFYWAAFTLSGDWR